jgi:hypothetical protein
MSTKDETKVMPNPFDGVVLERGAVGRSVSPVAKHIASNAERAELQAFYKKLVKPGSTMPTYINDEENWTIGGHVSVAGLIKSIKGDRRALVLEAAQSGVRLTTKKGLAELQKAGKGDNYTFAQACADVMPANRFGTGNWDTFKGLTPQEQYDYLKAAGAIG